MTGMNAVSRTLRWVMRQCGYRLAACQKENGFPRDFDAEIVSIAEAVRHHTKTTPERLDALVQSIRHIVAHNIPGDIVECGVWRGGSMMAVAKTLLALNDTSRTLYLFDTFEGMPEPTEHDVSQSGASALTKFARRARNNQSSDWCFASLQDVQAGMASTGYPADKVRFVKGMVEDTLPAQAPERVAVLRLDTDWYESTRHELEQLYPRLAEGGMLIVDDYADWLGAKKAVDEYLAEHSPALFLHRIDDSARMAVKSGPVRRAA